ncbi:unnamed protein product [Fraxinus pennsylvanica]|uniref:Basic blue protein n=1 Tax=Fraxinus pennsylvanica TaxID=56036 RepID=A0AAD1ZMU0_9LAMI|nr:unnamed protein product [Fraxinus pennsylvanica]
MSEEKSIAIFVTVTVLGMLILSNRASAAVYTVGDAAGWNFNVAGWENGKHFRAGDVLVFNYIPAAHNVVSVDRRAYNSCTTPKGAKVYQSGRDRIRLVRGQNCFICNFPGHCQSGMKIAINAM